MIFIFLVLIITLLATQLKFSNENKSIIKKYTIISFFLIGFLIAFRSNSVGTDTLTYHKFYLSMSGQEFGSGVENSSIEIGYLTLIQFLNILSSNSQTMFIFQGILVGVTYGCFIYRNAKNIGEVYISTLAFLAFNILSFSFTGYRQSISMAICIVAYFFIEKKKIISFFLIVMIAGQFHASAFLFIPSYFITTSKSNIRKLSIVIILGLIICINLGYFNQLMYAISERYEKYGIENTGNGYIFFGILIIILWCTEYFKEKIIFFKKDSELFSNNTDVFININYLTSLIWFLRLFTRTAERPCFYYIPATIILLSRITNLKIFELNGKNYTRICIAVFLIVFFIFRISNITYSFCFWR